MPELTSRPLGTDRENAPVAWVIQQMGSFLVGELFTGSYYRECLKMAEAMMPLHRPRLTSIYTSKETTNVNLEKMIAQLEDVSQWAGKMKEEGYHSVNTHAFITLWAAQEAGFENIIATIIKTNKNAAAIACGKFKPGQFQIDSWPWKESECIKISQKLEKKAIDAIGDSKNVAGRIVTLFSWFNIDFDMDLNNINVYNEASLVRNIIMHRYGYLNKEDADTFPNLKPWENSVVPITNERLKSYYDSIICLYLGIIKSIFKSEYM